MSWINTAEYEVKIKVRVDASRLQSGTQTQAEIKRVLDKANHLIAISTDVKLIGKRVAHSGIVSQARTL